MENKKERLEQLQRDRDAAINAGIDRDLAHRAYSAAWDEVHIELGGEIPPRLQKERLARQQARQSPQSRQRPGQPKRLGFAASFLAGYYGTDLAIRGVKSFFRNMGIGGGRRRW